MKLKWRLWMPKYWFLQILILLSRLIVLMPYKWLVNFGLFLGTIAFFLSKKRKNITEINLKIVFPKKNNLEIKSLTKKCFQSTAISGVEMIIAWFMSNKRFNKLNVETYGMKNFEKIHNDSNKGVLVLGCHLTCMEIIGRYIGMHYKPFYLIYQKHKNYLFEHIMTSSREKNITKCLKRKNMFSIIKLLKKRQSVWYAPDQDFGSERSVFAPFFGKKCATLVATSWLIKKTGAKLIPCYYFRKPDFSGYELHVLPTPENFPSGDDYQDAKYYNSLLEKIIIQHPEQYLWQHRRYKTRPPGEKNIY